MTARTYRLLTLWTCIGMFVVLFAGVSVTNFDAQDGCGTDWPLCNGKFVPAKTLESMIEFSHRAISGVVGLLVIGAFIATIMWEPTKRKEPIWYASGALFLTVLQAGLGAAAVKWPQSEAVLALHFGISLLAFTCTWLMYAYAARLEKHGQPVSLMSLGGNSEPPVPKVVYRVSLLLLIYCYFVVYLGAYIRHTGSGGGCVGWPLCNGEVIPPLTGATGIAFAHRIAALLLFVFVAALYIYVRKLVGARSEMAKIANYSLGFVFLQVLSGGLLSATLGNENVYVFTALLHTIIISVLFSILCLFTLRARHHAGNVLSSS